MLKVFKLRHPQQREEKLTKIAGKILSGKTVRFEICPKHMENGVLCRPVLHFLYCNYAVKTTGYHLFSRACKARIKYS